MTVKASSGPNDYVVTSERRIVVIDVHVEGVDDKADEYVVTLNGQHLVRLHPVRARRLGLFASDREEDWR